MIKSRLLLILILFVAGLNAIYAQHDDGEHIENHDEHEGADSKAYTDYVMHHIGDANEFHIVGDVSVPLPVILYDIDRSKLVTGLSSSWDHGHKVVDGFAMVHGNIMKVI